MSSIGRQDERDNSVIGLTIPTGLEGVPALMEAMQGTTEMKSLLKNECDVIYECRYCRNLFRSIPNFLSHKRVYCRITHANANLFNKTMQKFSEQQAKQLDLDEPQEPEKPQKSTSSHPDYLRRLNPLGFLKSKIKEIQHELPDKTTISLHSLPRVTRDVPLVVTEDGIAQKLLNPAPVPNVDGNRELVVFPSADNRRRQRFSRRLANANEVPAATLSSEEVSLLDRLLKERGDIIDITQGFKCSHDNCDGINAFECVKALAFHICVKHITTRASDSKIPCLVCGVRCKTWRSYYAHISKYHKMVKVVHEASRQAAFEEEGNTMKKLKRPRSLSPDISAEERDEIDSRKQAEEEQDSSDLPPTIPRFDEASDDLKAEGDDQDDQEQDDLPPTLSIEDHTVHSSQSRRRKNQTFPCRSLPISEASDDGDTRDGLSIELDSIMEEFKAVSDGSASENKSSSVTPALSITEDADEKVVEAVVNSLLCQVEKHIVQNVLGSRLFKIKPPAVPGQRKVPILTETSLPKTPDLQPTAEDEVNTSSNRKRKAQNVVTPASTEPIRKLKKKFGKEKSEGTRNEVPTPEPSPKEVSPVETLIMGRPSRNRKRPDWLNDENFITESEKPLKKEKGKEPKLEEESERESQNSPAPSQDGQTGSSTRTRSRVDAYSPPPPRIAKQVSTSVKPIEMKAKRCRTSETNPKDLLERVRTRLSAGSDIPAGRLLPRDFVLPSSLTLKAKERPSTPRNIDISFYSPRARKIMGAQAVDEHDEGESATSSSRRKQNLNASKDEAELRIISHNGKSTRVDDLSRLPIFLTNSHQKMFFGGLKQMKGEESSNPNDIQKYCCEYCDRVNLNIMEGRRHMVGHIRVIRLRCSLCGCGAFFCGEMRNHLLYRGCSNLHLAKEKGIRIEEGAFTPCMTISEADKLTEVADKARPGGVQFTSGMIVSVESKVPYFPDPVIEEKILAINRVEGRSLISGPVKKLIAIKK